MKTSVWGPSAWRFLHAVTFAYPEHPTPEQRDAAMQLFLSLRHMIPCGDCCGHYCSEIQAAPPRVESRDALSRWLVDLHNRVNVRLHKPQYAYEDAKAEYLAESSQCLLPTEPCSTDRRAPSALPLRRRNRGPLSSAQLIFLAVLGAVLVVAVGAFAFSNVSRRSRAPALREASSSQ
jgi:FAD-linked sulfhydryl oxidase